MTIPVLENITFERDTSLIGIPIRVSEAATKYKMEHSVLCRWADKGLVTVLERAPKKLVLDEASVKLAAAIFHEAARRTSPRRAGWLVMKALSA
jgi:hypothetical protein